MSKFAILLRKITVYFISSYYLRCKLVNESATQRLLSPEACCPCTVRQGDQIRKPVTLTCEAYLRPKLSGHNSMSY